MNFLYPTFLFGLSLISIPIIIHFFNFQRAKRIFFTNVEFLKTIKETTNARNKLKNILVLISRILFIIFLVLTFARPFLSGDKSAAFDKANFVSVYLDNSYSMQNEADDKALLDIAINQVRGLTEIFKTKTSYQLMDNSFDRSVNYFKDKEKFLDKLAEIKYANTNREVKNVYNKQKSALINNASPEGNYIFWVSDFQKSTSGDLDKLQLDSLNNFVIVPLAPTLNSNLFIDSVWLSSPFIKTQETNTCNLRITNSGQDPVTDKVIRLYIEGKQVSGSTISIKENTSEIVSLDFSIAESGDKKCKILIDDYPVVFDDSYHFILKVAPKIKICTIKSSKNNYINNVYTNEPFFENTEFSLAAIDYIALESADLIILENIGTIDNALLTSLRKAMNNGTSIAMFPSEKPDVNSYRSLLGYTVESNSQEESRRTGFDPKFIGVSPPNQKIPFFDGVFDNVRKNMSMPKGIPVIDWQPRGEKLLNFKNGRPFLTATKRGNGKIYLFASPLKETFSDFSKHALFVPVMYKLGLTSKVKTDKLSFSFNEAIAVLNLNKVNKNDVLKLKSENFELIPGQRLNGSQLLLNIPKINMDAGSYSLEKKQTGEYVASVAFNYTPKESQLGYYSVKELKEIFGGRKNVQIFENANTQSFLNDFKEKNISKQLWRHFLIMSLLFLMIETLLIRFWKTE